MRVDRREVVGLGLGAGLAAAAPAAAQEITASRVFENDPAGRFASAMRDIDAYAAEHVATQGLPGLTVAVTGPGGFVGLLQRGYANLDRRTPVAGGQLFQIGSISKSFTGLCIFRLMEAGKLRLEDPAERFLPEVPWPANSGITVQALLNHSAGLPDDAPPFPRGGDQRLWQGFPVGAQWSYSNLGYMLLGKIVERLEGRPLAEAIAVGVLRPLGMNATRPVIATVDRALYATGYSPLYADRPPPRGGPLAAGVWTEMVEGSGCVASTAADMALYMRWLSAAGQGRGAPLLTDAAAARYCAATIEAPGWATPGAKYANGLAVTPVGGRMLLHHTGGMLTFNSSIHVDPVAGVGCFASTNVGFIPYRPRALTAYACARMRAAVEGTAPATPPSMTPPSLDVSTLQGGYVGRSGPLEIAPGPRGLVAILGERRIDLEPEAPDAFLASDPRESAHLLVFRRQEGRVLRAWWGEAEYVRRDGGRPVAPFSPPAPAALAALAGHYANDDPWRGGFRVTVQGPQLIVDGTTPAVPLPGGGFRVGDKDWSPERLRFDAPLGGRPTRATLSGVDHVRRAT
jgi:CubicO group peptidase (beta-lactamase class C family)